MKFLSIAAFALFLISCSGWGYVLTRWSTWSENNQFAFMSVVGIACLIFLGGVLNLARLAAPVALDILLVAGLACFVVCYAPGVKGWLAARRGGRPAATAPAPVKILEFVPLALLIIATGFYAFTLLPADAFNFSDDFYTYIPRPMRMLQTGTLAGNPYDILGLDSLGANAFLHGFVLLGFPFQYLQGFDAVFSFALTGLLLIAIGKKFSIHWVYSTSAVLALIAINPQSVNISAIYISDAIILGLIFASYLLLEQIGKSDGEAIPKMAIGIFGLLIASLIALKVTFVIYALVYFAVFFMGLFLVTSDRWKIVKIGGLTVMAAFVAVLPWLLLHAANYASAIQMALHSSTATPGNEFPMTHGNMLALFSTAELFYGDSFLSYGLIVLELAVVGCFSLYLFFFGRLDQSQRGYLLVAVAACAAAIISYFSNGIIFAPEDAVRYSCPLLIATFPVSLLAASKMAANRLGDIKILGLSGLNMLVVPAMSLLIIAQFWNHFLVRIEQAYYQHQTLSFALDAHYLQYNRYAISPESRQEVRAIQYQAQPDQKILAWISMPMHLDFSRNEIYSVMAPGLLNPWLNMPLSGNVQDMVQYLKGQGIRYIMWEHTGYGMPTEDKFRGMLSYPYLVYRKIGQRNLYLRKVLEAMMKGGSFIYNSNGIVLFDLQQTN